MCSYSFILCFPTFYLAVFFSRIIPVSEALLGRRKFSCFLFKNSLFPMGFASLLLPSSGEAQFWDSLPISFSMRQKIFCIRIY